MPSHSSGVYSSSLHMEMPCYRSHIPTCLAELLTLHDAMLMCVPEVDVVTPPPELARARLAGEQLRSAALPAALQAVTADPAEHALYLGAADGRIFELSLVCMAQQVPATAAAVSDFGPCGACASPGTAEGRIYKCHAVPGGHN